MEVYTPYSLCTFCFGRGENGQWGLVLLMVSPGSLVGLSDTTQQGWEEVVFVSLLSGKGGSLVFPFGLCCQGCHSIYLFLVVLTRVERLLTKFSILLGCPFPGPLDIEEAFVGTFYLFCSYCLYIYHRYEKSSNIEIFLKN